MIQPEPLDLWKARSAGEAVNAAFVFFRTMWTPLSRAFFVLVMPVVLLFVAVKTYLLYNPYLFFDTVEQMASLALLGYFLYMIIGALIVALINSAIARYAADEPFDKITLLKDVRSHYFRMLGASFIQLFIIALGVVPLVALGFLSPPLLGFLIFLSAFPGIYLLVSMLIYPTVVLYEDCGLIQGVTRSFELVKNYWWQCFGTLIITAILAFVLSLSLSVPLLFFQWIDSSVASTSGDYQDNPFFIALTIAREIGYWLITTIPIAASAVQYFNLMERKEGVGVLRQIEAIGREELPLREESW